MYKEFYLMQREPFASIPLPDLFYDSQMHKMAWQYLVQGLKKNEPILLVTGEYGTGKTLLCLKLLNLMQKNKISKIVFISTPSYSFSSIIKKILNTMKIEFDHLAEEQTLLQIFYDSFENSKKKQNIYIVIDDIQECNYSLLNNLKMLATFNSFGYFPIKIIMFGHKRFLKILEHGKFVPFKQRIKRIYPLKRFDFDEIKEYIYFRLIYSGADGKPIFDDGSIARIQKLSKGVPRLINNWCDNCLWEAGNRRFIVIDEELVKKVEKKFYYGEKQVTSFNSASTFKKEVPEEQGVKNCNPLEKKSMKRQFQRGRDLTSLEDQQKQIAQREKKKQVDLKTNKFLEGKNAVIIGLILLCLLFCYLFFIQMKPVVMEKTSSSIYSIEELSKSIEPPIVVTKSVPAYKRQSVLEKPVTEYKIDSFEETHHKIKQHQKDKESTLNFQKGFYTTLKRFEPIISMIEKEQKKNEG